MEDPGKERPVALSACKTDSWRVRHEPHVIQMPARQARGLPHSRALPTRRCKSIGIIQAGRIILWRALG
jgi:hypothetical protein